MSKKIIQIDEEKCVGCGLCANACQQSAIEMVNGKAKVVRENSCDGIGNCLPVCPVGAISFSDKDIAKVAEDKPAQSKAPISFGCPSMNAKNIQRENTAKKPINADISSQLAQWPVQIKLVPISAPYFAGANLLVAADCTAFAYGNFHGEFMKNKVTLIGCPKLDEGDYSQKLTEIIAKNDIKSVTVVRMEVPCCGGIERAVITALKNSGKFIPWQVVTITIDGEIKQ